MKPLQVVTGDAGGNFRVWDVHKANKSIVKCVEAFSTWSRFTPRSFAVAAPSRTLVAVGYKLTLFRSLRPKAGDVAPAAELLK